MLLKKVKVFVLVRQNRLIFPVSGKLTLWILWESKFKATWKFCAHISVSIWAILNGKLFCFTFSFFLSSYNMLHHLYAVVDYFESKLNTSIDNSPFQNYFVQFKYTIKCCSRTRKKNSNHQIVYNGVKYHVWMKFYEILVNHNLFLYLLNIYLKYNIRTKKHQQPLMTYEGCG